jgi:hypothetical protein
MMLEGICALQADSNTEIIVLISKPPGKATQERVLAALRNSSKPSIVAFLGDDGSLEAGEGIFMEKTLEAAAGRGLNLLGKEAPGWASIPNGVWEGMQSASASLAPGQSAIRGLFSGGTLCYEALLLLRDMRQEVSSNLKLPGVSKYEESGCSQGHVLIDLGGDEYTLGRPHPMIDVRACSQRLINEASKPEVGVILLDVVLGYGSNPDPASELAPALQEAQLRAAQDGRGLACVVMLCGTDDDPQGLARQEKTLTEAGAIVVRSNTLATRIAVSLSSRDLSGLEDYRE